MTAAEKSSGRTAGAALLRREGLALGLSLPAVVFLLLLFAYPVLKLMTLGAVAGTFAPYERAFLDGLYLRVLWNTTRIALLVTLLSLLLGYAVAWFITTAPPFWRAVGLFCLLMPFWTSILVRTYAWMVLFGRRGVVNETLLSVGLIERPLVLLNTQLAVIVGMVHVLMPFLVFPLLNVMKRIDPNLLLAAEGLGAPRWRIFLRIYAPLTLPGVLSGCVLVFILSMGFFITPALLGGGRVTMIAMVIEQQVREFLAWEFAGALSLVLLIVTLGFYGLFKRVMRGDLRWS